MVEAQPMHDARAAVVSHHGEAIEAERGHRLDLVLRHRALGVVARIRLLAVAVAAQVRRDDRAAFGEPGRHLVPHDMRLRIAVQQQHRRAFAADAQMDPRPARRDVARLEPFEHPASLAQNCFPWRF
jgi:hypothetical protein